MVYLQSLANTLPICLGTQVLVEVHSHLQCGTRCVRVHRLLVSVCLPPGQQRTWKGRDSPQVHVTHSRMAFLGEEFILHLCVLCPWAPIIGFGRTERDFREP